MKPVSSHLRINPSKKLCFAFLALVLLVTVPWNGQAAVYNDYNADGVSDLAVLSIHNHGLSWYVRSLDVGSVSPRVLSWNAGRSSNFIVPSTGQAGQIPVPGDYNGDGIGDLASYSPDTKYWAISSLNGASVILVPAIEPPIGTPYGIGGTPAIEAGGPWGWPGEIPVTGDYNGDGWSDCAMYWPAAGRWYIQGNTSTGHTVIVYGMSWGASTMIPVPGDYDGDGISDLALWDFSTGRWYIRSVAGNVIVWGEQWGAYGMVPVPGDYNGDNVSDLALYHEATGKWYIRALNLNGTAGAVITFGQSWGYPGAIAVPGDYDGDGCFDLGVWDCRSGAFYCLKLKPWSQVLAYSGDVQWGGVGMIPAGLCGPFIANPLSDQQFLWKRSGPTWQLLGSGGRPPYSFTANSPMPRGLTLSRSGLVSGTPQVHINDGYYESSYGYYYVDITLKDSNGCSRRAQLKISIYYPPNGRY